MARRPPTIRSRPPTRRSSKLTGFLDHLDDHDARRWHKACGWANGDPFWCGWRGDNATVSDSVLTLRLDDVAASGRPFASGEYRTLEAYGYGRVEGRLKAARGSGVVTGLFTYCGDPHDEIDIEILGVDTTRMQVNYFAQGVGGHETVIELGFDAALDFHTYAFEWSPESIQWFVDGRLVHVETGSRGPLPAVPGQIMANLWPARQVDDWAGRFTYAGTPITALFDYFSFTST